MYTWYPLWTTPFFLLLNEMLIFCVDAETEVPLDSPEDDDPFKVPAHASPFDQPASTDGEQVTEASPFNPSGVRMGDGIDVAGKKAQQQDSFGNKITFKMDKTDQV